MDNKKISRGERRRYLEERLRILHQRTMVIEKELVSIEDNRFYRTCIFGSARLKPETKEYNQVTELARLLAIKGIDVLTGGGPGLMEAANLGAKQGIGSSKAKSLSYGISIELDFEPVPNPHLDVKSHHLRFSSRLDEFMRLSRSIVVTPGGIGTLLELFFAWQLIQVKHISYRPIVLLDVPFWEELITWMKKMPLGRSLVSQSDFDCLSIVNTPEEAFNLISTHHDDHMKERLGQKKE